MRRRAVVVVLDGLRRDMVGPETTPELHRFAAAATRFAAHRSVFPSATRVVSACFATGCLPARHGLQGNSVALMEAGKLVPHDVGRPEFMDHWRAVRGHTFSRAHHGRAPCACGAGSDGVQQRLAGRGAGP